MTDKGAKKPPIELRKYPNRRYYDVTQSRQATLDDIYRLVRDGRDVTVTDSKTGDDITVKVLAQIILERDSPNLRLFPVELLHHVIRTSEPLFREFMEKYFSQALRAFLDSRRQFEQYVRFSLGLSNAVQGMNPAQAMLDWTRMMMRPYTPGQAAAAVKGDNGQTKEQLAMLQDAIETLTEQVEMLKHELQPEPAG